METIDDLFKGPDPITSDQLTGQLLNSVPLLGTDVWQEAINKFDEFAETEVNAGPFSGATAISKRSES